MPAPRSSTERLKVKGSAIKNPKLFKDRRDPVADPLGPPSAHLDPHSIVAWKMFVKEIPWLAESDRTHLEIASMLRGRLIAGQEVGVQALNLLRLCLGQMGGNPSDRSRIKVGEPDDADPTAGYFQ